MDPASLVRARDSLVPALLNGLINGAIAHLSFRSAGSVPLSLDLISARQHTVWGQGVTLAFALGVILSLVTAKIFARHVVKAHPELGPLVDRPMVPWLLRVSFGNAVFLFGWFVALAVLWQRAVGTVEVGPVAASALVGGLAAVITVLVEVRTKRAMLRPG